MCFHLRWAKRNMRKMFDLYKSVGNQGDCEMALNPKFRWGAGDPKQGIDIQPYIEEKEQVTGTTCPHSYQVWVANPRNMPGGRCYSYKVLARVCFMISFAEHPNEATYTWEFNEGCYENGEVAHYEQAVPGGVYTLDRLPIEVKEDHSV